MLFLSPFVSLPVALAGTSGTPVAEAGLGVFAYVNDRVILNGEGSSDPDGQAIAYAWTQVSGPPVALTNATSARPEFLVEQPGTVRFQLTVSDGTLVSAPDFVAVVIPDRAQEPLGGQEGCVHVAGAPWLGLLVAGLLRRR